MLRLSTFVYNNGVEPVSEGKSHASGCCSRSTSTHCLVSTLVVPVAGITRRDRLLFGVSILPV
jgi:hypothetical protein